MAKVILSFSETSKWCIYLTDILCKIGCLPDKKENKVVFPHKDLPPFLLIYIWVRV